MPLRPRTTPTPMMWPTTPHAKVSARVKPAGSPVCNPESLTSSFSPAVDFLFADGANPNRPANSIRLVDVTIIYATCTHIIPLFLRHLLQPGNLILCFGNFIGYIFHIQFLLSYPKLLIIRQIKLQLEIRSIYFFKTKLNFLGNDKIR